MSSDRITGCLLGLAMGDALGARYEGGVLERFVWRLIGRTRDGRLRWTDDTQMALDLAESLLEHGDLLPDSLARRFAESYRWSRGYGPGTARVLKRIRRGQPWDSAAKSVYPDGSYGNGAAMRAPVLALYFAHERRKLLETARISALVTHAHPLGVEGAVLIALATHAMMQERTSAAIMQAIRNESWSADFDARLSTISEWLHSCESPTPRDVARKLGNGMSAPTSCPTALYIALRHRERPFEELVSFCIGCSGDVDTIGAMAGALWGAANGAAALPSVGIEARERIIEIAAMLSQRHRNFE